MKSIKSHFPLRLVLLLLAAHLSLPALMAQESAFIRYSCMPAAAEGMSGARGHKLPVINTQWDAQRTYPVAVVLVEFSDKSFTAGDPGNGATMGDITDVNERYRRLFSEEGFNRGKGPGCVTDYFVCQSGGLFHPRFDVYGPVTLSGNCKSYGNYGVSGFREALQMAHDSYGIDFSAYDWNNDGQCEHVVFVYAGYGGNENKTEAKGCIWPNTYSFSPLSFNGVSISDYSASPEMWVDGTSCGIGTICHEYSHTLGLPDLYPTAGSEFSVVDEWDLMDGGNYSNDGWCPPSYSAHEKMLLGWKQPEELYAPATIEQMLPVSQDGDTYIVYAANSNEFFLLENRQWSGWDSCTPGHGLLISHVDYSASAWRGNSVNSTSTHHRYEQVHADNLDYNGWEAILHKQDVYVDGHSRYLSGSPYPFISDEVNNTEFTDTSLPPATTYSGTQLLSKPITDIQEFDDGTVTFNFMGGILVDISELQFPQSPTATLYDLQGRRLSSTSPLQPGLVIKNGKKYINQH